MPCYCDTIAEMRMEINVIDEISVLSDQITQCSESEINSHLRNLHQAFTDGIKPTNLWSLQSGILGLNTTAENYGNSLKNECIRAKNRLLESISNLEEEDKYYHDLLKEEELLLALDTTTSRK